ncbi:MAG: energy transducer TonB [Rhizomicrobium sp.]|jgi:TonB family protein
MGPGETRRYGFGMSRETHIAFVAVYLTLLLAVSAFGIARFLATVPAWHLRWPAGFASSVPVADRALPVADPALGRHVVAYPPIAQRLHQEGDVLVGLTVQPDGSVGDARIIKSSGSPQLDASALVCVGYWRYRPAIRNGKPIAANLTVKIRFKLAG